jgi:hypothetical protein
MHPILGVSIFSVTASDLLEFSKTMSRQANPLPYLLQLLSQLGFWYKGRGQHTVTFSYIPYHAFQNGHTLMTGKKTRPMNYLLYSSKAPIRNSEEHDAAMALLTMARGNSEEHDAAMALLTMARGNSEEYDAAMHALDAHFPSNYEEYDAAMHTLDAHFPSNTCDFYHFPSNYDNTAMQYNPFSSG